MNYGLYLSASGVMTNLYRQDVFSNNLANVETAGFKPHIPALKHRLPESEEDPGNSRLSDDLLDRLGGGALAGPTRIDFSRAPLERSDNPLDAALIEDNTFFAVEHVNPQTGQTSVRLTRDGRFNRNSQGQLITTSGHRVLNPDDQPITIPDGGPASIAREGRVLQEGQSIARLQVARVPDGSDLQKEGDNLFSFTGQDPRQPVDQPQVRGGYIETSGVNPIQALSSMISASKTAQGNSQLIRYHDRMMDQAANRLGAVA